MANEDCPFCEIIEHESRSHVAKNEYFVAFLDRYPVSEGHTLVVPRNHVTSLDRLNPEWGTPLVEILQQVKADLDVELDPDGFNVGLNDGREAGQTIDHLHWHLIPRNRGDVPNPEGGVRGVIPDRQTYSEEKD